MPDVGALQKDCARNIGVGPLQAYVPGFLEVGRLGPNEAAGEETLLGSCATQPWSVTVNSLVSEMKNINNVTIIIIIM